MLAGKTKMHRKRKSAREAVENPGSGLDIFTDKNQRSILGGLNFENLYSGAMFTGTVFFGVC